MLKRNQKFLNRLNIAADASIAFLVMQLAYWLRFSLFRDAVHSLSPSYYVWLAAASSVLHVLLYGLIRFYRSKRSVRYRETFARIFICETSCLLFIQGALFFLDLMDISRLTILIAYAFQLLFMNAKEILKSAIFHHYRKKGYNQKHILLVGDGESARNFHQAIAAHLEYGFNVVGYCAPTENWQELRHCGDYESLPRILETIKLDEVVIALPAADYEWIARVIQHCEKAGVLMRIIPCYYRYISSKMEVDVIKGINMIQIRQMPLDFVQNAFLKRAADLLLSVLILAATSPVMLAAAIGIKLTSPGHVIFKQQRMGKKKKLFEMYKFRSMRVNDQEDSGWSTSEDTRRTHIGSLLRKYSIDELPQFFNVIKGDMSIVGPRPEMPFYVEQFRDEVPLYMVKHYVKPGITGWAQIHNLRGDTSIRERIDHDIYYIENWSWWLDIQIMFLTVFHMKNAERTNSRRKTYEDRGC